MRNFDKVGEDLSAVQGTSGSDGHLANENAPSDRVRQKATVLLRSKDLEIVHQS